MKNIARTRRHERITKTLKGTTERPRLVVFRSKKHMYAQIINDADHKILASASTMSEDFSTGNIKTTDKAAATLVGKMIAKKAKDLGINKICFDRAGYMFHGRVKSLSDGAREGGLEF